MSLPEAEREATEVLQSLLSIERIGRSANSQDEQTVDVKEEKAIDGENSQDSSDTVDVEATDPMDDIVSSQEADDDDESNEIDIGEENPSPMIDNSAREVLRRFAKGCECQGACFADLNPESVNRHRLNIAELTKEEHDMYLMGVCMASLANPRETSRHKERIRQRASYVYHGKGVCLDAFLYLENVTHYQLKRIRSHLMTNGVVPRVHGNVRKKPHNTFSLDTYKGAETFLKETLTQYTSDVSKHCFVVNESCASIYEKFKQNIPSGTKVMGYTTFRHFLQKQFPNVRFIHRTPGDAKHQRNGATSGGQKRRGKVVARKIISRTKTVARKPIRIDVQTAQNKRGEEEEEEDEQNMDDPETT